MKNGNRTKIEIALLKQRADQVESFIKEMQDNHLPHIYESITDIKIKMAYYVGIAFGISAIIGALINHFWK